MLKRHADFNDLDRNGEIASTVVIAEVVCIVVKKSALEEGSEGVMSIDLQKLQPVTYPSILTRQTIRQYSYSHYKPQRDQQIIW